MPRRQVVEAVDFVVWQSVQEIGNIGLGIEIVGLCRLDDGHDGCRVFSASVGAREGPIASSDDRGSDRALGGVIVDGDGRIVEEQGEGVRAAPR
jgi:hypothetical protein